jgi:hypothetical protein
MDSMRRVFISSTSEDLALYRNAARDAVILAGCHPVMMEYFTPQGKRKPYAACMREVDVCDNAVRAALKHSSASDAEAGYSCDGYAT